MNEYTINLIHKFLNKNYKQSVQCHIVMKIYCCEEIGLILLVLSVDKEVISSFL